MKVAVIGSRNLHVRNLSDYLPEETTELVSGGAKGIDSDVRAYAEKEKIPLTEFFPNYRRFGKFAPLKRNLEIIAYADIVLAFWDGQSHGTKFVIEHCQKLNVPIKIILLETLTKFSA